jgi:glycosidase
MLNRPSSVFGLDFAPRGPVFPSPVDWRDQFIYQLLIDRFDDGKDHPPYDPKTTPRGGRNRERANQFQGGTLRGVTRRLDYVKGLGCTAVWISPPFKQRQDDLGSYHGYGIQDFLDIDPRFGTTADLQELVREAHRRGMYVILDVVINHTGDVFGYAGEGEHQHPFLENGGRHDFGFWRSVRDGKLGRLPAGNKPGPDDAVWPVELQDPDAFKRRGHIRDFKTATEDEAVNGDFFALKELNSNNPKVVDALIACYKYWIAVADVDGYRIDTVRNIEPKFCSTFANAMHEYAQRIGKHNFVLFGELVGDDDVLRKYVGNNTPAPGEATEYPLLDAVLDFPLYAHLDEVIKGREAPAALWERYGSFKKYYRNFGEAGRYYVTFLDNHDQTHRPWRRFQHQANDDRLGVMGVGYLLCNLGIPCIYYGTEQGFDGGGDDSDVHIRENMFGGDWGAFDTTGAHFFNTDHPIYRGIARVARIRPTQPAMRYGRQYFREISGNGKDFGYPTTGRATLAFSCVLDTDEVVAALNLDTEPRQDWVWVDPKLSGVGRTMVDLLGGREYKVEDRGSGVAAVRLPLEPRTMVLLKAK